MEQLIKEYLPYVYAYRSRFFQSCEATLQMFLIAGAISFVLGLFFGVVLTITREGGIKPCKPVNLLLDVFINIFRAIPFVILLIFLIPLTRAV
ncbi:MAG: ABC transporter permease, partial [Clostridia bacterium]|nr:ABC transporter permease [Clostridia bacterium]